MFRIKILIYGVISIEFSDTSVVIVLKICFALLLNIIYVQSTLRTRFKIQRP